MARRLKPLPTWTYKQNVGKVYLLWAVGTTYFKIGFTSGTVRQRLSDIQVSSPLSIQFICAAYGERSDEKHAHRLLKSLRVRGEWFNFSGKEKQFKTLIESFVGEGAYARLSPS